MVRLAPCQLGLSQMIGRNDCYPPHPSSILPSDKFFHIGFYPCVVVATTTLQNFPLVSFWSLPTNLSQWHVLPCQVHKLQ